MISNYVFVILLAILTGNLTLLKTKGSIDRRFSKLLKKPTIKGRKLLIVLFVIMLVLVAQDFNSRALSNQKDKLLNKERNERDSIISTSIENVSVRLKEQNLDLKETIDILTQKPKFSKLKLLNYLSKILIYQFNYLSLPRICIITLLEDLLILILF